MSASREWRHRILRERARGGGFGAFEIASSLLPVSRGRRHFLFQGKGGFASGFGRQATCGEEEAGCFLNVGADRCARKRRQDRQSVLDLF
jgi:hypothetical protein